MQRAPHRLVDAFESKLEPLEAEFHRAYWDSQVHASPENDRRRAELELELRSLKGDATFLAGVTEALAEELHDPLLRRQLQVLRLALTADQMTDAQREELVELSSSVESDFATFRAEVDCESLSENEILEILETSSDSARSERAWRASKELGGRVAERVRELARLRNHAALALGYPDHYGMALDLQEISEEWLFKLFDELEELTREPFLRWKAGLDEALSNRFGTKHLRPWHYADPFFQYQPRSATVDLDHLFGDGAAVRLAQGTFGSWGIDIGGVLERSDLFPRQMKSQHAFCLDVDRSGRDVRILANIVPGERWVEVMLHECGHAAYDVSIDGKLPYLLREPAHTFVTEAVAILSGRLTRDPEWLVNVAGVSPGEVDPLAQELARSSAIQSILFARWVLVMAHFERALYADPEADLEAIWWDLVQRFQFVQGPEDEVPGVWAAKVHVASAPVYYHNYLLGELLASQLMETMRARVGGVLAGTAAGDLLREYLMKPGNSLRWDTLIQDATGAPLSPHAFAAEVAL